MKNQQEVIKMLAEFTGVPYDDISLDKHLKKDLGLDSLDVVELTMELEYRFGILPNWDDEKINTVQDLVEVIDEHVSLGVEANAIEQKKLFDGKKVHLLGRQNQELY